MVSLKEKRNVDFAFRTAWQLSRFGVLGPSSSVHKWGGKDQALPIYWDFTDVNKVKILLILKVFSGSVFFLSCVCVCVFSFLGYFACFLLVEKGKRSAKSIFLVMDPFSLCLLHFGLNHLLLLMPVVRVWRMLCEHVAKVSKLGRFLSIGKGITVSRLDRSLSLYPCLPCTDTLHTCMHRYLSTNILTVFLCFNDWTANLWKTSKRYLRQACVTLGSCPRHRFVCSHDVKILFLSTQ